MVFERVDINEGNSWNSITNVVIPRASWYYLHLDVASCAYSTIKLEVNVNHKPILAAQFLEVTHHAPQSRGRSAVLQLTSGDTLTVSPSLDVGTICLKGEGLTAFYGMLLVPT